MGAVVTNHAYERARERLRWSKETTEKMAGKALAIGYTLKDTKAKLRKYVIDTWAQYKKANNIRIYGENIYLFDGEVLITLYQIPLELRKYIKLGTAAQNTRRADDPDPDSDDLCTK